MNTQQTRICQLLLLVVGLLLSQWSAPMATQAATAGPIVHLVQAGDTLSAIAQQYGTSVPALMNLNGLTSTVIYVGQQIIIVREPLPGSGIGTIYTVVRGDTLGALAQRFNTSVTSIMNANGLRSMVIEVGQPLAIPRDFPAPVDLSPYVVQRGDTLSALARRFHTTVAALLAVNQLPTTVIYIGQVLNVPSGEGQPTTQPPPPEPSTGNPGPFPSPSYQWINVSLAAPLARVSGQVSYGRPQRYALHGMGGEVLTISLSAPGIPESVAGLSLYAMPRAGGAPLEGRTPPTPGSLPSSLTHEVTGAGDLVIQVDATTAQVVDFTLLVEIKPSAPPTAACTPNDSTVTSYQEPGGRYCLLYPSRFRLADEVVGRIGIYGPPLDQSSEPLFAGLTIVDEGPANGTPLQLVVDYYIQNNGEGANVTRQAMILGGEAALVVEGLPGRTGSRQLFTVHAGQVYHLSLYPVDPAFPQVAPDVEELWQTVTGSFTFYAMEIGEFR